MLTQCAAGSPANHPPTLGVVRGCDEERQILFVLLRRKRAQRTRVGEVGQFLASEPGAQSRGDGGIAVLAAGLGQLGVHPRIALGRDQGSETLAGGLAAHGCQSKVGVVVVDEVFRERRANPTRADGNELFVYLCKGSGAEVESVHEIGAHSK